MIDRGIVISGIRVERKDPRKINITRITITDACSSVRITSLIEAWINSVES